MVVGLYKGLRERKPYMGAELRPPPVLKVDKQVDVVLLAALLSPRCFFGGLA